MDNEQVSRMDKRVYALEKRGASIDEGMDAVDTHVYATQGHALDELKQQAVDQQVTTLDKLDQLDKADEQPYALIQLDDVDEIYSKLKRWTRMRRQED